MVDIAPPADRPPEIANITNDDLRAALRAGWEDFRAAPSFGIVMAGTFSVIGILIFAQLVVWGSTYWVLPLMAGFPLIGPFAAIGLYEVSRRREAGQSLAWNEVMSVVARERYRQTPSMAFVVLFFFLVWVYLAHLVFALTFGLRPLTDVLSAPDLFLSAPGIVMLLVGTAVGGALALVLFAVTVISVPLLLDREIDVVTAMIVSVRSVLHNRGPMLTWGVIVAVLSAVAMIPFFLGMLIVFPILGHATWHLYRRVTAG